MQIKYKSWNCKTSWLKYDEPRNNALELIDAVNGDVISRASLNPEEKLGDGEIAIKDYSENKGTLDILVKAGIVSKPVRFIPSGFVSVPVCLILKK